MLPIRNKTHSLREQTKTNYQETIEFKRNQPRQIFSFDTSLSLKKDNWLLGLTFLEVGNV